MTEPLQKDVFISYRQKEPVKTWVRKQLVTALEREGLRLCIDYRDFRLGEPLIKEIARAVETCRYTLAILTPEYLESNFCDIEPIMAEHLGLESSRRRLLLIMREPCQPRVDLRSRLWLDMTRDDEFDDNIVRLAAELKQL